MIAHLCVCGCLAELPGLRSHTSSYNTVHDSVLLCVTQCHCLVKVEGTSFVDDRLGSCVNKGQVSCDLVDRIFMHINRLDKLTKGLDGL